MSICMRVIALRAAHTFAVPLSILRQRFPHGMACTTGHNDPFPRRLQRSAVYQPPDVVEIWRKYWAVGDELFVQYQAQSWSAREHPRQADMRIYLDMRGIMLCLWPMYYEWRAQETKATCDYEIFGGPLRMVYDAWA
jgi:hypothetical protein